MPDDIASQQELGNGEKKRKRGEIVQMGFVDVHSARRELVLTQQRTPQKIAIQLLVVDIE